MECLRSFNVRIIKRKKRVKKKKEKKEGSWRTFREEGSSENWSETGVLIHIFVTWLLFSNTLDAQKNGHECRSHERANSTLFTYDRGNERRWGWQRAGVSLVSARGGGAQLKPLEAHHHHTHTQSPRRVQQHTAMLLHPNLSRLFLITDSCRCRFRGVQPRFPTRMWLQPPYVSSRQRKLPGSGERSDKERPFRCSDNFEEVRVFLDEQLKIVIIMPVRRGHVAPQNTFLGIIIRKFEGQSKYYKSNILDSLSPYHLDDKGSASINIHRQI